MKKLHDLITKGGDSFQSYFLLIVRLYWGISLFEGGISKFYSHESVAQFFLTLGIPFAEAMAYVVAFFETVGGLSLALGLGARLMSVPLIVIFCTAYATAHRPALLNLFHDPNTFFAQAPFHYLWTTLMVFSFGPGKFSFDALIQHKGE